MLLTMQSPIDVYADVSCPFAYIGLVAFLNARSARGAAEPYLRVHAWPLELINGVALDGAGLRPKIDALRASVAPMLFAGFHADGFPTTSLPAFATVAAAYRVDDEHGESMSIAIRRALFEDGADIATDGVLAELRARFGTPDPTDDDRNQVTRDWEAGRALGVKGSPHYFVADDDYFCPFLQIDHVADGLEIERDQRRFREFIDHAVG